MKIKESRKLVSIEVGAYRTLKRRDLGGNPTAVPISKILAAGIFILSRNLGRIRFGSIQDLNQVVKFLAAKISVGSGIRNLAISFVAGSKIFLVGVLLRISHSRNIGNIRFIFLLHLFSQQAANSTNIYRKSRLKKLKIVLLYMYVVIYCI